MRALSAELRRQLQVAVIEGRNTAETGVRATMSALGVREREKPAHLSEEQARLRRGLRAKQRQLGGEYDVLVWDAAYEQWHKLLFARFLAENGLLRHPEFGTPVTLEECDELADDLGEPDGWSVAARFAAEILPGLFRLEDPCVQLRLAPEHRIALEKIVAGLPVDVFAADDSLGWVYQYWQSERKDQVNASEVKIGGADLGPVTQMFTENYMVRFLLENSLGAWWAARHPDSPLVKRFEYLRFNDDGEPAAGRFEGWPDRVAEVTVLDPCCGSGHFLVEAFGMLWRMRAEEEGVNAVAAQDAVLRGNLFGLELDPRCVQIAMFAIAFAAWKQGGGWRDIPPPQVACSGIPAKAPLEEWTQLARGNDRLERALERLHGLVMDAETLGSLINPRTAAESAHSAGPQRSIYDIAFEDVAPLLKKAAGREGNDPAAAVLGADVAGVATAAALLARTFTLVSTNVPYLARRNQSNTLAKYLNATYPVGKNDLATAFALRLAEFAAMGGTVAAVLPNNWTFLASYEELRRLLLRTLTWRIVARLGPGAFAAISGEVVNVILWIADKQSPSELHVLAMADYSMIDGPAKKASALLGHEMIVSLQTEQRRNPESRLILRPFGGVPLLGTFAHSYKGMTTGDDPRWKRYLWEVPQDGSWTRMQSSSPASAPFSGCSLMIPLRRMTELMQPGVELRGSETWGKRGVAVSLMGLHVSFSVGVPFDQNVAVVLPESSDDLSAIWHYCTSDELERDLRRLDQKMNVTTGTLDLLPVDVARWREVAWKKPPIPEPSSNDPSQWLFEGRPDASTEPLQVGVARLVGYRWPDQVDDDLDELADDDGIVCLSAVTGELPANERLLTLLDRAYGPKWSPAIVRQLLEETGSRKKNLSNWLRDDFFGQHCSIFFNRPFIWHIWDGRIDGFSALMNYHRLDRAGLEKMTYTYLGDWIERQRSDAAEGIAEADLRLASAEELKRKLEAILKGEPPYDVYVRWKELHAQPLGWDPDLKDGVRVNIRPFVKAGVLRSKVNIHWKKDRGKNSDGSERRNDLHYTIAEKQEAREKARQS